MLNVSEQFYSIQGEGMSTGAPSYFVRLKACNLLCGGKGTEKDGQLHDGATWRCDTVEVWLKGSKKSVDEIVSEFGDPHPAAHLIITGGEPLLQQEQIPELIQAMHIFTEVETNGTIVPSYDMLRLVDQWNVSPKLRNSGMDLSKRVNPDALTILKDRARTQFKFVVSSIDDVNEAIVTYVYPLKIKRSQVWLMPAADNVELLNKVGPEVAELAKKFGFNYSHRLHITLWNKKTGV